MTKPTAAKAADTTKNRIKAEYTPRATRTRTPKQVERYEGSLTSGTRQPSFTPTGELGTPSTKRSLRAIPAGHGIPLREWTSFAKLLKTKNSDDLLHSLHRVIYNRLGAHNEFKSNLRDFKGMDLEQLANVDVTAFYDLANTADDNDLLQSLQETDTYRHFHSRLEKWTVGHLADVIRLFSLTLPRTKEEKVEAVVRFLLRPEKTDKASRATAIAAKKKSVKEKAKAKADAASKRKSATPRSPSARSRRPASKEFVDSEDDISDEDEAEADGHDDDDDGDEESTAHEDTMDEDASEVMETPTKKRPTKVVPATPSRTPKRKATAGPVAEPIPKKSDSAARDEVKTPAGKKRRLAPAKSTKTEENSSADTMDVEATPVPEASNEPEKSAPESTTLTETITTIASEETNEDIPSAKSATNGKPLVEETATATAVETTVESVEPTPKAVESTPKATSAEPDFATAAALITSVDEIPSLVKKSTDATPDLLVDPTDTAALNTKKSEPLDSQETTIRNGFVTPNTSKTSPLASPKAGPTEPKTEVAPAKEAEASQQSPEPAVKPSTLSHATTITPEVTSPAVDNTEADGLADSDPANDDVNSSVIAQEIAQSVADVNQGPTIVSVTETTETTMEVDHSPPTISEPEEEKDTQETPAKDLPVEENTAAAPTASTPPPTTSAAIPTVTSPSSKISFGVEPKVNDVSLAFDFAPQVGEATSTVKATPTHNVAPGLELPTTTTAIIDDKVTDPLVPISTMATSLEPLAASVADSIKDRIRQLVRSTPVDPTELTTKEIRNQLLGQLKSEADSSLTRQVTDRITQVNAWIDAEIDALSAGIGAL
ncbi:hypothetical protein H4R33_004071 [Dimargaris cristalligena]|nr:hypothetical protein H4R33_004071 [Dimargaris cristalligena]